ncbi:polysaccharide biosynthesis protein [Cohnella fermenti]|nr:polysaccharide biosynthesis protein [Cohnella fermenti]
MKTDRREASAGGSVVWRGAAILGGAALLSKLIGTLQKIPLQNLAGDQVFGLYSAVYSLAVMWMTLASAGVPIAVSALVAEREAAGDSAGARRVLRSSLALLSGSGLAAFAILFLGADAFARWMGVSEAADAIRASSLALLFAPMTAALRGYSQGRLRMVGPAASQLAEQTARVAFMLIALLWAIERAWSPGATAAAVHGGLAVGGAAGLAAIAAWLLRERRRASGEGGKPGKSGGGKRSGGNSEYGEARLALLRRIAAVALPIAASSVVAPLFGLIDAFTLPRLLQSAGATAGEAMASFGEYNRGIALLQLIVMAAGAAGGALVPAMTAARTRGDRTGEREQAAFALRLGWLFGAAAAIGLAILARPINVMLFADDRGTAAMALLAFAALGGTLQAVYASLLQGLGDLRSPALNLAVAVLLKAALNALLAPSLGIGGAALAALAAYGAAALLNALALRRRLPPRAVAAGAGTAGAAAAGSPARGAWRLALALAAMAAAAGLLAALLEGLTRGLAPRAAALLTALPSIAAGAAAFAAALVAGGAVAPREWRALPGCGAGSRVDRLLLRLRAGRYEDLNP